ncbi:hypothetical protein CFAM422_009480 [Trichoderma lentiforme]|uniref:Transmembrane protein n=1 Tax=Trichoderma lentiforme TaxID=1567552 RepID=A0A9P4X9U5_9HYPO|nr:hypothetical protein CFAM422_009480 [Trichoderma lentiforme]
MEAFLILEHNVIVPSTFHREILLVEEGIAERNVSFSSLLLLSRPFLLLLLLLLFTFSSYSLQFSLQLRIFVVIAVLVLVTIFLLFTVVICVDVSALFQYPPSFRLEIFFFFAVGRLRPLLSSGGSHFHISLLVILRGQDAAVLLLEVGCLSRKKFRSEVARGLFISIAALSRLSVLELGVCW